MGQPSSKYIVAGFAPDGSLKGSEPEGFDSEEQAEHAAIELAGAYSAVEYRVYELKSRWKTQTRVERV